MADDGSVAAGMGVGQRAGGRRGQFLRAGLVAIVVVLGLVFVAANRSEVPAAWRALRHARPAPLVLAAALSFVYLTLYAGLHWSSLRAVGTRFRYRRVLLVATSVHFMNVIVVNSAGMGGLPLLLREADGASVPRGKVATAYLLTAQLGHFVFAGVLAVALVVAHADGEVTNAEWLASGIFALYTGAGAVLLIAAARSRGAVRFVHGLPGRVGRRLLRIAGRPRPPGAAGSETADQVYDALNLLIRNPQAMLVPLLFALAIEVCGVATLWAVLRGFGVHPGLVTPLVAYSIGIVFGIVGFLPAGLGFVEAGLGVALTSAGVPGPETALAVVTYRVFEVWVPFVVGAITTHWASRGGPP